MTGARPAILEIPGVAENYSRWLDRNGLADNDANAWRFAAETASAPHAPPRGRKSRRGLRLAIAGVVAVAVMSLALVAYALATPVRWTVVVQPEKARTVEVPAGTWHVEMSDKEVCYGGQLASVCAALLTAEWDSTCELLKPDVQSRPLCDAFYESMMDFKEAAAGQPFAVVERSEEKGIGRLNATMNTKTERQIVERELTREAVCYLGFLGECPSE